MGCSSRDACFGNIKKFTDTIFFYVLIFLILKKDIPTQSLGCVTSLTSDQVNGNIIIAGFGDGSISVYDRRLGPEEA